MPTGEENVCHILVMICPLAQVVDFFHMRKYIYSPQIYDDVALNLTTVDFGGGTHNIYGQKKLDVGLFATLKIGKRMLTLVY